MSFGNPFSGTSENEFGALGLGFNGFEVSLNFINGIPDPNHVANSTLKLIFKSLLKRDETTKEKALNELAAFVTIENLNELKDDLVLMTWVQIYPKLSISESKSVRVLAHQVHCSLIYILQKAFMKYLKDSIPVLLSGIYDIDSSVSNATLKNLSKVFNNDQTKINNLWIMFTNEILNFIDQVLNKETVDTLSDDRFVPRDEAELKYLRLVNATISMLSHLIQLSIKLDKLDSKFGNIQKVFSYQNLWHFLLINSNNNNQRIVKSLLSLTNAVLTLKPELLNDKAWKYLSKRFFKALMFVKKLDSSSANSMIYSSLIVPILSTLINLNNANPDFYNFDQSSREKVIEFLKIGSLNSDPSYYSKLNKYLNSSHILDVKEDSTVLESILLNDFKNEMKKNSKLREGGNFIVTSLCTYLDVFQSNQVALSPIFAEALKVKARFALEFVEPLVKYIPNSLVSAKLDCFDQDIDFNILLLLKVASAKSVSIRNALTKSFESLRRKSEEDEEGKSIASHPAFQLFEFALVEGHEEYKEIVEEFLDELPSFITPSTIETTIEVLVTYSRSKLYNQDIFIETFDGFIIKLSLLGAKDKLLSGLDRFNNKELLLENSEELQSTLDEYSSTYDFTDDNLFKPHLITNESVLELFRLAENQGKIREFFEFYFKYNTGNKELFENLVRNSDLIENRLWPLLSSNPQLNRELEPLLSDTEVQTRYTNSLKSYVSMDGPFGQITPEFSQQILKFPELFNRLFNYEELITKLFDTYGGTIDSRLALGNPLETNINILNIKENVFPIDSIKPILNYARFLSFLDHEGAKSDEFLIYLGVVSEVSVDYSFLHDESEDDGFDEFRERVGKLVVDKLTTNISFSDVFNELISTQALSPFLNKLIADESNCVASFYKLRVLFFILNQAKAAEVGFSTNSIDLDKFDKFVKTHLRVKDLHSAFFFITMTSSISELLANEKFERIRNLIGSELIGSKQSEILHAGLKKVTVLTNFLTSDNTNEDYTPLPPQRLNMIINELNKWFDSDIAFEEEFGVLRIQSLKLLSLLNDFEPLRSSQNLINLTIRLLEDSIGLIRVGEGENLTELKFLSLKLYLNLKKQDCLDRETLDELSNELLEYYFESEEQNEKIQPVFIIDELFNRILNGIPLKKLEHHYDALVIKYFKTSKFEQKRVLSKILESLITSKQQDLVIEFELEKNKEDLEKFQIDDIFVDNVSNPPKLDHELDDDKYNQLLIQYLWNWKLILTHFKDITLNLRNLYIKQLQNYKGEFEVISKFLGFLSNFLILEGNEKEYLKELEENPDIITTYAFEEINDLSKEIKNLSVNIYYDILNSIGSLSANWFNNIKDRGFKSKFESFTINIISPILIKNKITTFQSKVDSFTSKDDNLTIKINSLTNEIKATYLIDEQNLEIVFKIPDSYPLKNIEISGPQRIGVKEQQWKAWLLSSQRIISLTNGEIEESLEFFLKNVKFHFKGFEECAICYSILHSDNSLPSKKCSTCDNKFHAGCLYKWFKSSGGNTCPLCRSTFNFR